MYDNLEKHVRSLEAIGEEVNTRQLVSLIKSKVPEEVLHQLNMQKEEEEQWTVEKLRKLLGRYISSRESVSKGLTSVKTPADMPKSSSWPKYHAGAQGGEQRSTSGALFVGSDERGGYGHGGRDSGKRDFAPRGKTCAYCKGAQTHWSDECSVYPTLQARRKRIQGNCCRCLFSGHVSSECRSNRYCYHCGESGKHHRSLCPKQFPENDSEITAFAGDKSEEEKQEESQFFIATNTESTLLVSGEHVIMQTATVKVTNPMKETQKEPVMARMLLDSASHRCYMTDKLADKLGLETEKIEELSVITFGSKTPKKFKVRIATVEIELRDKGHTKMPIKVSIVPVISGKIQRPPTSLNKELENFTPLADTLSTQENERTEIDFLLGADYYMDILDGHSQLKVQLSTGLYVLYTKLGFVLGGRVKVDPPPLQTQKTVPDIKVTDTVPKKMISKGTDNKSEILKTPDKKVQNVLMDPNLGSNKSLQKSEAYPRSKKKVSWESDKQKLFSTVKQTGNPIHLAWWSKVLTAREESQKRVESERQQNSNRQKGTHTVQGKPQMVHSGAKKMGYFRDQSRWTKGWKPPNTDGRMSHSQTTHSPEQQFRLSGECRADRDLNWRSNGAVNGAGWKESRGAILKKRDFVNKEL